MLLEIENENVCPPPPPPFHVDLNKTYEKAHFEILNHLMNYKFGFSYPAWKRYKRASLRNTLTNISILRAIKLPLRWVRYHFSSKITGFKTVLFSVTSYTAYKILFQICDHPSIICFASPHNLKKLAEIEKEYSTPVTLNALLRRKSDIAFADHTHFKTVLFLLKVSSVKENMN